MFLFPSSFSTHLSMKASNNRKCCEAENSECLLSTNQNALPSDDLTLAIELSVASTHSDCHKICYRSKTFSKSHSKEWPVPKRTLNLKIKILSNDLISKLVTFIW